MFWVLLFSTLVGAVLIGMPGRPGQNPLKIFSGWIATAGCFLSFPAARVGGLALAVRIYKTFKSVEVTSFSALGE